MCKLDAVQCPVTNVSGRVFQLSKSNQTELRDKVRHFEGMKHIKFKRHAFVTLGSQIVYPTISINFQDVYRECHSLVEYHWCASVLSILN